MAVVNLQKDTRWGDLGTALGGAGAAIYQQQKLQEATQGTTEIFNDPNAGDINNKLAKIAKEHGWMGVEIAGKLQAAQIKQQQLATQQAQEKELLAHVGQTVIETQLKRAQLPTAEQQAQANVASTQAGTADKLAAAARSNQLLPGEVKAQATQNALAEGTLPSKIVDAGALAEKDQSESQLVKIQTDLAREQLSRIQAAGGTAKEGTLDDLLRKMQIKPDSPTGVQAKAAYNAGLDDVKDPNKGMTNFLKVTSEFTKERTSATARAGGMKPLDPSERKTVGADAEYATSLEGFVKTLKASPGEVGIGAKIGAFMSRHGLEANPQLVDLMENQAQLVASQALKSGAFISSTSTRLAGDITPSIERTPIPNLIAAHTIAERKVAFYKSQMEAYGENTLTNTKPLQSQIDKWQKIAEDTHAQGYGIGPGKFFYTLGSDQIDPKTLKPLVEASKSYGSFKGEDIINAARIATEHAGQPIPNSGGKVYQPFDPYEFLKKQKAL